MLSLMEAVKIAVDELDPQDLLKMGAPADEYNSEINDLVILISNEEQVTLQRIKDIFFKWFGLHSKNMEELTNRLIVIQNSI